MYSCVLRARCVAGVGYSCARMADKAAFTAWLGVVVDPGTGVKYQLSGTLKALLTALYDAGAIDVDDVYLPSCVIKDASLKDAVAVWAGYLDDAVAAAKAVTAVETAAARAQTW